jgi:diguanylate cyclase
MNSTLCAARPGHSRGPWAAAAILGLSGVWIASGAGGGTVVRYVDDLTTAAAAVGATVWCSQAAGRHSGRLRIFWTLLAGATAAWAIGELTWAFYDLVLGIAVPVPSWADAGYLSAIPLAAAALLVHPAIHGRSAGKARALLDGLILASALFLLAWALLLGPLWHTTDLTTVGGLVALAYPLGDVLLVFLIVLIIRGTSRRAQLDLWLLLGGLLAITCSDAVYAYLTEVRRYATGNAIDIGWIAAYLAIALAARSTRSENAVERDLDSSLSTTAIIVPFLPMLAALGFAAARIQLGRHLDRVGLIITVALVALVLLRQALLARDLLSRGERGRSAFTERLLAAVGGSAPPVRGRR